MLRRHRQIRMQIQQLLDACLFAVSFWLAYTIRSNPQVIEHLKLEPIAPFESFLVPFVILTMAAPFVLETQGFYNRPLFSPRRTLYWTLLKGSFFLVVGLTLMLFFMRQYVARWVIIWFGGISFLLVAFKEELLRWGYRTKFTQAQLRRRFILMGTPEETAQLRAEVKTRLEDGIEVLVELNLNETPVERLVHLLHEHSVNGVILSAKHSYFEQVEAIVRACEVEGIEAWLVADFFKTQLSRTSFDDFWGRPVMVFRTAPDTSWQSLLKQLLDFILALVAFVVVAIPFALVALLIKFNSPGPVFFQQRRAGLNGQPFVMYKFRTMVTNAEQLKDELAALNEMSGPVFKLSNDPRITRIGKFLRKFSLDELPQLLNVLRGEMSLVGPRPLPVDEVRRFDDVAHRRRLSVKPGLTCLWQVSGRNQVSDFKEWVRLDLEYIDNWSLWLDMKILLRTIPAVLTTAGAK
jgi:exopolysaccharide biosynthesis polyprenyl glycosylphosphotransferase